VTVANVNLWGERIGAVAQARPDRPAVFEYEQNFIGRGIEPSPIEMPTSPAQFSFPALPPETFAGLPGMLADSLPDRFGNKLIDDFLVARGMAISEFDSVARLCYLGTRGMGALEFEPASGPDAATSHPLDVTQLRELADAVLAERTSWTASMTEEGAVADILQVGTSAGGARAKAVVAWNPETSELRSGQGLAPEGFGQWLIKFDGVSDGRREVGAGQGFGLIEYAYSRMARAAGIDMHPCELLSENGRNHFMTKRFDRTEDGGKLHLQSLGGLCHFDFNLAGAYSYEQAFLAMQRLDLTGAEREQQFRRMLFNVVARNQDDHVKNIAFLMDQSGVWRLSPAYDVTYSYNPAGAFTSRHQMTINGKSDGFELDDFAACAEIALLKRGRWRELLDEVTSAVKNWSDIAAEVGVHEDSARKIADAHRLDFAKQ
jgi:serine/threonine-protein kinase HipA